MLRKILVGLVAGSISISAVAADSQFNFGLGDTQASGGGVSGSAVTLDSGLDTVFSNGIAMGAGTAFSDSALSGSIEYTHADAYLGYRFLTHRVSIMPVLTVGYDKLVFAETPPATVIQTPYGAFSMPGGDTKYSSNYGGIGLKLSTTTVNDFVLGGDVIYGRPFGSSIESTTDTTGTYLTAGASIGHKLDAGTIKLSYDYSALPILNSSIKVSTVSVGYSLPF